MRMPIEPCALRYALAGVFRRDRIHSCALRLVTSSFRICRQWSGSLSSRATAILPAPQSSEVGWFFTHFSPCSATSCARYVAMTSSTSPTLGVSSLSATSSSLNEFTISKKQTSNNVNTSVFFASKVYIVKICKQWFSQQERVCACGP